MKLTSRLGNATTYDTAILEFPALYRSRLTLARFAWTRRASFEVAHFGSREATEAHSCGRQPAV